MLSDKKIDTFTTACKSISGVVTAIRAVYPPLNTEIKNFPMIMVSTAMESISIGQNPIPALSIGRETQQLSVYVVCWYNQNVKSYETATETLNTIKDEVVKLIISTFPLVATQEIIVDRLAPFAQLGDIFNIANTPPFYSCRIDFTIQALTKQTR